MSILKASEYLKGMKYSIVTKNNYDTLAGKLMFNTASTDILVATEDVTITPSWDDNFTREINQRNNSFGYRFGSTNHRYNMAVSNVAVQMASTTIQFRNLTTPITSGAYVKLTFSGTTYKIPRGNNFSYNDVTDTYVNAKQLSNFIKNHNRREDSSWSSNNSSSVDYSEMKLNMFAWVKKAIKSSLSSEQWVDPEGDEYANHKPEASDILTTWAGGVAGSTWGLASYRFATNCSKHYTSGGGYVASFDGDWYYNGEAVRFPATYPNPLATNTTDYDDGMIALAMKNPLIQSVAYKENYEYITTSIRKIDDYNFDVIITYPKKYQYVAASRYMQRNWLGIVTMVDLDSYAFEDFITNMHVELYGTVLDENSEDFSNSLNVVGGIVDPSNKNILNLSNNELLTKGATWSGRSWKDTVVEYILERYRKGLSIIELDVPAEFAIENDIKINSAFQIKLLDNTLAERGYRIATYEVKNITKVYNNSQFTWNLKLLENKDLSITNIDGAKMIYFTEYHSNKSGFYKHFAWENVSQDAIAMVDTSNENSLPYNVAQKGIGIKLPQVASDNFVTDIGTVILEDLVDKDLKLITIAVVVKVPFYARGSWWNTSGTSKIKLGYFLRTYETAAAPVYAADADHYEASVLVSDPDNTLNDYCEYHTMVFKVSKEDYLQGVVPFFYSDENTDTYLNMTTMQMQWYVIDSGNVTAKEAYDYLKDNNILDDYFREDYELPTTREITVTEAEETEDGGVYYYEVDLTEVIDTDEYIVDALSKTPSSLSVYEIYNDIDDKRIIFENATQVSSLSVQLLILKNPSQEGETNV